MSLSPARIAAFEILLRVEQKDAFASELLHSPQRAQLSPADHGLATELVMGVLRWRSVLDREIEKRSSQPLKKLDREVLTALRMGAYQLQFLERIPAHAAVDESVDLVKRARKRSAAPFVNAVLRKLTAAQGSAPRQHRQAETADINSAHDAAALSAATAHPHWLVERWVTEFGIDKARAICGYDQQPPETAIRLAESGTEEELEQQGITLQPGRILTSARRVVAGDITKTEAFRKGRVAVQDEASQLVALLVGKGPRILDCCAAPGGKTRVLAERNPSATHSGG